MQRVLNASSIGSDKEEDDQWTGTSTWSVNDQIPGQLFSATAGHAIRFEFQQFQHSTFNT
jgi:hypothetical protein